MKGLTFVDLFDSFSVFFQTRNIASKMTRWKDKGAIERVRNNILTQSSLIWFSTAEWIYIFRVTSMVSKFWSVIIITNRCWRRFQNKKWMNVVQEDNNNYAHKYNDTFALLPFFREY